MDKFLPDEILNAVANQDNEDLKNILKNMKTDAADWSIVGCPNVGKSKIGRAHV